MSIEHLHANRRVEIALQPKQARLLDLVKNHDAVVIGLGGGRGAAKSSGLDRVALTLMYEQKDCIACMVMRNADQVFRYHIEPMRRDFPWLEPHLKTSWPAKLRIGKSELDFSYAENYDDVERRFRSANYRYIFIDQAEQFSEREIREIRKSCRRPGKHKAKIVLSFNMRGAGIQTLRKWFYLREFNRDEDPNDYVFLKINPWDNIEWVRPALEADGYTEFDYYAWSDEQRRDYAAARGEYTRQLATDDEVIRAADWFGGWDSLEGAYFANVFDLESTRISSTAVEALRKPWAQHWIAQDWGKSHYCATYWNFRVTLSPSEAQQHLGWTIAQPVNAVVTYREMIVSEMTSAQVARKIVECTPAAERSRHKAYFLSPECVTDDPNSVGSQQAKELRAYGMPGPIKADNDRIGGWSLMAKLLEGAKFHAVHPSNGPYQDVWLISSECAELLKTLPMLMRDPKNLDDVLKTDKSQAKIEQDIADAIRYSLKSMLAPKKKTEEMIYQEKMNQVDPAQRMMLAFRHEQKKIMKRQQFLPPSWRANL